MNISQLLQSTQRVSHQSYGPKNTFQYKPFGEIYLYNKSVKAKSGNSIIEVSMMIKSVTDKKETNHKVMIAINNVKQQTVKEDTLVARIRNLRVDGVKKYEDEKAYTKEDLVILAIEGKPFVGETVIKNEAGTYTIIEDNVSKESEIWVWCSCSNYYWVWQYYNVENGVDIFGDAPARYVPRTEAGKNALKTNRPMRNPNRKPGMCKHIMLLLALLMDTNVDSKADSNNVGNPGDTNVIKEARSITRNFKANIARFKKTQRLTGEQFKALMKSWEKERARASKERGLENDPVLAPKRSQTRAYQTKTWQKIQNNMVGRKGKRR